jgi:predicted  nucleic acid-binding Zn-ribbon protein
VKRLIKKCKRCGEEFEAANYRFQFCDECKKAKAREYRELHKEEDRERARISYIEKKKNKSPYSVEKTHREILKYNEKHGTRLSYGKYQALKRLGKI